MSVGILITNLGTPEAPTSKALRSYLAEFLWDPRVIEIPRILWWLILHCFILRIRPHYIAKQYQKIWTKEGSPLLSLTTKLVETLNHRFNDHYVIELGMRYGKPSIVDALEKLNQQNITTLIVLPLYPQYAAAVTGSTFDIVSKTLQKRRFVPSYCFINGYHDNKHYINALTSSIKKHWETYEPAEKLLFSFHGIPQRAVALGDPYKNFCYETAKLVAEQLSLPKTHWIVVFQSRFGREEWIKPYCTETLQALAKSGVKSVEIVAPGFAVDCLETLEEIAITNKKFFIAAGGERYHYIPALNADAKHVECLLKLLKEYLSHNK